MNISNKDKISYYRENTILILCGIFLFSLVIRMIKLCEMSIIDRDSARYLSLASDWFDFGAKYAYGVGATDTPPLYPFILSLGGYIGLSPIQLGYILALFLGALIPIAVFYITYAIFERKGFALIGAVLAAVQPYLILGSARILRDALYLPLLTAGIAFALYSVNKKSLILWLLFTLCIIGASATRVEGIVMIPIFLIWVAYELLFGKDIFFSKIKYLTRVVLIVLIVYFGLIYSIRCSLSDTKATWGNTDIFSMKYLGRPHLVE